MSKRALLRVPLIGPAALLGIRWWRCRRELAPQRRAIWRWLLRSREYTNFTYDLDPRNRQHLVAATALVTGLSEPEIEGFFVELETDREVQEHHAALVATHRDGRFADRQARFARRLAWYAVIRARHPACVVETGVDKGLGALVICAALRRNHRDGHAGRYVGLDLNPAAGWLLAGPYADYGTVVIGDALTSLRSLPGPIDLFINDSDHSATYEMAEYNGIADRLASQGIIIGDNVAVTDCLHRFSRSTGRRFLACQEVPRDHWFPGAAIGFSWRTP